VPMSHRIKDWVNGLLYQPTSEVSGILPIPISTQVKAGPQPMIEETTSQYLDCYLACRQGTLFAVIGVHTVAEKKLFSQLMKEEPNFNQNNQEPDWKSAVQIWNIKYANGKTIFYKVSIGI